jgi:hypothetical protein
VPLGWIAAASAVGDVIQGVSAANASSISSTQLGMEQTVFGEQQQYAGMLQQLVSNPSSVASLPGYQFQMQQGSEAVARNMASAGFMGSGNEAAALEQYGQGLASSFYGQQTQLLSSLAGLTAPSSPSQLGNAATAANTSAGAQWSNTLAQMGVMAGRYGTAGAPGSGPGFSPQDMSTFANMPPSGSVIPSSEGGGYMINSGP